MMIMLWVGFIALSIVGLWLTMPDDLQIDENVERDDYEA